MASERKLAGVIGFFEDPGDLMKAMAKVKDANYKVFDCFTPYPVHGMDDVMGIKRSILPFITFTFGITGTACAFALQYWTSVIDWPIIVGGKPFNSWPAFVPVMFELTILFAGLSTAFGMFGLNRLPNVVKKSFDPSITNDRFCAFIGAPDADDDDEGNYKAFSEAEVAEFLRGTGAGEVRSVYEEGWF